MLLQRKCHATGLVLLKLALLKLLIDPSRADLPLSITGGITESTDVFDRFKQRGGGGGGPDGGVSVPADVAVLVLFGLSERSGD